MALTIDKIEAMAPDQASLAAATKIKASAWAFVARDSGGNLADPLFQALNENREAFHGLLLADLASALDMPVEELIAGSAASAGLGPLILKSAFLEGIAIEPTLFSSLSIGDAGHSSAFLLKEVLPEAEGKVRDALLEFVLAPGNWSMLPPPAFFEQVHCLVREPLSPRLAANLIRSSIWRDAFAEGKEKSRSELVLAVAPLIPRALSEEFIRDAETCSRRASLYHRFLLTLLEQLA